MSLSASHSFLIILLKSNRSQSSHSTAIPSAASEQQSLTQAKAPPRTTKQFYIQGRSIPSSSHSDVATSLQCHPPDAENHKFAHIKRRKKPHTISSHCFTRAHLQYSHPVNTFIQHPRRESAFQSESPKNRKSVAKIGRLACRASLSRSKIFIFFSSRELQLAKSRDFIPLQL